MRLPNVTLQDKFKEFLDEDVGAGDITTEVIIPAGIKVRAQIIAKETAVIAGIAEAEFFFGMLDIGFAAMVADGAEVSAGTVISEVSGDCHNILAAERTVLNLMMRMSGIATSTAKLVKKIREAGLNVRVAATRKTCPGLRYFDKKAVIVGGGDPHRFRLDDAFLIKDNHIAIAGGIEEAVKKVVAEASFSKKIEVEAKTLGEAVKAAELGVEVVMLDNMTAEQVRDTLTILTARNLREKVLIEISGCINETNILDYARLAPNVISLGALTHSAKAVDISLDVVEVTSDR